MGEDDLACAKCEASVRGELRQKKVLQARLDHFESVYPEFIGMTLDDYEASDPAQEIALLRARMMVEAIRTGKWVNLLFYSLQPSETPLPGETAREFKQRLRRAWTVCDTGRGCG